MYADMFVLVLTFVLVTVSGLLHLWKGNLKFFDQDDKSFAIGDAGFAHFKRTYYIGHLIVLFADSIQASYTYYLFDWYNVSSGDIVSIYVAGLVANLLASLLLCRWLQKLERRVVCFVHCVLACTGCFLKTMQKSCFLFSRLFDGVAVTLLLAPFQEWYVHEHVHKLGFPKEWVQVTFREVSFRSTFQAILAGYVADCIHRNLLEPLVLMQLCIPIYMFSCLWIYCKWAPNRPESNGTTENLLQELLKSGRIIFRRSNVLVLCVLQSLYESSFILFAFVWTPLFLQLGETVGPLPYIGAVYGCLMAGTLLGLVVYCKLSMHLLAHSLLSIAMALSFTGMSAALFAAYPKPLSLMKYNMSLLLLVIYQLGSGIYFPTMQRLQKDILPAENRSTILSLFRIPLNLLAITALHNVPKALDYGNWMLLCVSAFFNFACLIISFILARMIKQSNVDYFMLELKSDKEGEV